MTHNPTGLFLGGSWHGGGDRMPVLDKFTGDLVAQVDVPTTDQVDSALVSAATAVRERVTTPLLAGALRRAAELLHERSAAITAAYVAETGFTPADAQVELGRAGDILRRSAEEGERLVGEMVPVHSMPGHENRICFTQRMPVGVVAAIAPFNAPLSTVAHKIGPALAAGNAVVLKPAEATPLSAMAMVQALADAGLPPGRLQLLCGPGESVGERIVTRPQVDFVTFTGSTRVGRRIRAVCGLARTHLELGSNSPTIVWEDADLGLALPLIVRAGYRKAGQVCTSVQRLIVHRRVVRAVVDGLADLVRVLPHGDPRAEGTAVGPVIDADSADRAMGLVADAVSHGARVLAGGTREGNVLAPTLLGELPQAARLARAEAFAPIIGVVPVDTLEQAVRIANSTSYGLQAGVFCQDVDTMFAFARELAVGGVMVNETSSCHPDLMPYGGVKDSGHGLEGPAYAVREMTDTRTLLINVRDPRR